MTAPDAKVELVADPLGREVLRLGEQPIGFVMKFHGGRKVHAIWKLDLPPVRVTPYPATSMSRARQELLEAAARWFDDARLGDLARQMRELALDAVSA